MPTGNEPKIRTMMAPSGNLMTVELLSSGDIEIKGYVKDVHDFLKVTPWEKSHTLKFRSSGAYLTRNAKQ